MANPVVHWEIAARDRARSAEFYQQLFGWEPLPQEMPDYSMYNPGEGGIGGGIMQAHEGMPNYVTFYVHVEDLAASLAKAESLGGRQIVPPTPIPGHGSFAMFTDPDGNVIGLWK